MAAAKSTRRNFPAPIHPQPPVLQLGPGGDYVRTWPADDLDRERRQARAHAYHWRCVHRRIAEKDHRRDIVAIAIGVGSIVLTAGLLLTVHFATKGGVL